MVPERGRPAEAGLPGTAKRRRLLLGFGSSGFGLVGGRGSLVGDRIGGVGGGVGSGGGGFVRGSSGGVGSAFHGSGGFANGFAGGGGSGVNAGSGGVAGSGSGVASRSGGLVGRGSSVGSGVLRGRGFILAGRQSEDASGASITSAAPPNSWAGQPRTYLVGSTVTGITAPPPRSGRGCTLV